ncbi:MAG: helix-turn-helix transcriptional regulator [Eggerthellaceae bacterium]|nr:helix-turn-helix transcriptional regulator [Eggerthellaceae bacterium]
MESLKDDLYDEAIRLWGMASVGKTGPHSAAGDLYRFSNKYGEGEYWVYFRDNLFAVNAYEMSFVREGVMRYRHAEHLTVVYYEDIADFEQSGDEGAAPGMVSSYIAEDGAEYVARLQPGAHVKATSITISPDYYRDYLSARFGDIPDVRHAFSLVDGRRDVPELISLFKQIRAYRGEGMAADMFYEGAVSEALALVLKKAEELESGANAGMALPEADRSAIEAVDGYIRSHLADGLSNDELAGVACMGLTKFKSAFRQVYATTPQNYVTALRIDRACELLRETDLPVASVAQKVGYRKPGAFALAFRKRKGVTPTEFRG